ncbi:hypothetical protein PpBr36_07886 [Pyricularia pennisetigena]|uniref:hypothetical protein n=1 Tax=Pyricularia pennisetigena TaxID=1578925 RepID=UPI00114F34EB|nr:hypothetical protein PpBr36_07886 [Pyricularia pennisetigena]TLS25883.1 hypothetical protein PpBr36_07886 [Pyricularia pennisetigena]
MHFTLPFIVAVLASVATASPVQFGEATNAVAARSNEIQTQASTPEALQKRTPVGWDSQHVWHPNDEALWRVRHRHRAEWELRSTVPGYYVEQMEKQEAEKQRKQKSKTEQGQTAHDYAAANARLPKHAPGRSRGGKGGSNPAGGR